jgi:DNA-binding CsgD family transcriptional regulator/tetratricopeptide (TPR) repeat protein
MEVAESLRSETIQPLTVLAGPGGVDLAAAAEELCIANTQADQSGDHPRLKVVNLSFSDPKPEFRLTDLLAAHDKTRTVLLVKNIQYLHPEALSAFEATIRQLAGTTVSCVCTIALPLPPEARTAFAGAFDRLRREGLLRHVNLRPRPAGRVGALITETLRAQPEPLLVSRLWELTRGWPGALVTALAIYRDNGMMSVVDRHAYLTGHSAPALSDNDELVLAIRRRGTDIWSVAKAIAVLSPLGEAAPRLIGAALGIAVPEVLRLLIVLEETGTLRYRSAESVWRFRIPLVAAALRSRLGPFERRRLAQSAVSALWSGEVQPPDPFYLADQLVAAGRMVDFKRAREELLANAERVALTDGERAIPWLRAAADLTTDRSERAGILLAHARTCLVNGRPELGLESSDAVLCGYSDETADQQLVLIYFLHLAGLHAARDLETLQKIAKGGWWPWPGTRLQQAIARAFALSLLGRWQETQNLLEDIRREDHADEVTGYIAYIGPIANLWLGVTDEFDRDVATLPARVEEGQEPIGELTCHTGALLALGELDRAEKLIALTRKVPVALGQPAEMIKAVHQGKIDEALELTRKHLATSAPNGCDANQTVMFQLAATIQLLRGKLARSRELLDIARSRQPTLPHALAVPEAWYELIVNDPEPAREILRDAVLRAEENGVVAFTDVLWANLADIDHTAGRIDQLPEYLHKVEKIHGQLGTEPTEIRRLTLHALVHGDRGAADAALELAKRRRQPLESAVLMERLVRYGLADPALLSEVYSLLGELDALLCRALIRPLMREYGIAVPGRQATVTENEHLLAVLMTEGLGNKQIAKVLLTSEKSVEGRVSRLFSRTGYQSRVELATAMLSGRFEPEGHRL